MGKSKSITVGQWYYVAFQDGLTIGPIDAFLAMEGAGRIAWEGALTASGAITINKPNLWGGEKDQGGMVGTLRVMFGEEDQERNAYLVSVFGNKVVSWRGFCTVVWEGGKYGAMNPWPQKRSYRIRTIKAMWDDGECWYPDKAEVPLTGGYVTLLGPGWEYKVETFSEPNSVWNDFTVPEDGWSQGGELPFSTNGMAGGPYWTPTRSNIWLRRRMRVNATGLTLNIGADNGCVVWVDGVNVGSSNPTNIPISSNNNNPVSFAFEAKGEVDVVVKAFAEYDAADEGGNLVNLSFTGVPLTAMNPAHILVFLRTSRERGGEPLANINEASAQAAADWFYANGFGLCTRRQAASESPAACERRIQRVAGCSFTRSLVDGQWYIDIANGEYDLESLPVLTDDDVLDFKEVPATFDNAVNSVSVRFFDVVKKQHVTTPPIRAAALVAAFGVIHKTFEYPEISNSEVAMRVAARELADSTTPRAVNDLATTRVTYGWRPNQYFRLQLPKRGIADRVCLVAEIQHGQLRSGAIKLRCTEALAPLPDRAYAQFEHGVDTRPSQIPRKITAQAAFEAPYVDVVTALPRAELAALPEETGYLVGVAADPATSRDFTMLADAGAGYAEVGGGPFCPTAKIVESAPLTDPLPTAFTLSGAVRLDEVEVGAKVLWVGDAGDGSDDEWCRVDAINVGAGTITLGRACADTVPHAHAADSRLFFYDDAFASDTTEYADGESIDVKLLTNTWSEQLDETEAIALPVTFDQRQYRPYPPGKFRINGQAYPAEASGTLEVTWVHRDRALQADQLVDTEAASIGPEPGTTYSLEYYAELGETPLDTETAITGTAGTPWVAPSGGRYRIELFSVRDGVNSWQRHSHTVLIGYEPWTPEMLPAAPKVWIDETTSVTDVSGNASAWTNKGTLGGSFSAGSSGTRPSIIVDGLNGHRVLRFDGSNDYLRLDGSGATGMFRNVTSGWSFTVLKKNSVDVSATSRGVLYAPQSTGATRFSTGIASSVANALWLSGRRLDGDATSGVAGSAVGAEWVLRCDVIDWANGDGFLFKDGQLDAFDGSLFSSGSTSNTNASGGLTLGAASNQTPPSGGYMDMDLALLIVDAGTIPSEGDRARLEGWAAHHYDLASNLPDDHPFRHVPPYQDTPVLQASFASAPTVFGFVAAVDGGNVGVAAGDAVSSEFGTLLAPAPSIGTGEGIFVASDGTDISLRIDGITMPVGTPQAVVLDHGGATVATLALSDQATYWDGSAAGVLEAGEVYYVRIESA